MEEIKPGMAVVDGKQVIGHVKEIRRGGDQSCYVMVSRSDGRQQLLAPGTYTLSEETLHLGRRPAARTGQDRQTQQLPVTAQELREQARDLQPGEELKIPVVREEAVVETEVVERGALRINKKVGEREEVVVQPVMREEISIQRVPVGRVVETAPEPREEGDTLIVPVLEEMLVVEKRLVLKEEIHITRQRVEDQEEVRVALREEHVEVERLDGQQQRELGA